MDRKIVAVAWNDPMSVDEWTEEIDIDTKPATIYSVGYIAKENDKVLAVCANWDKENEKMSCIMVIPKKLIISKKVLK